MLHTKKKYQTVLYIRKFYRGGKKLIHFSKRVKIEKNDTIPLTRVFSTEFNTLQSNNYLNITAHYFKKY